MKMKNILTFPFKERGSGSVNNTERGGGEEMHRISKHFLLTVEIREVLTSVSPIEVKNKIFPTPANEGLSVSSDMWK